MFATFASVLLQRGGRGVPVGPGPSGGGGGDIGPLEGLAIMAVMLVAMVLFFVVLAGAWALIVGIFCGIVWFFGEIVGAFRYARGVQRFLMACGLILLVLLLALGVVATLCATGVIDRALLRVELLAAVNAVLG